MSNFLKSSARDKVRNGTFLGVLFGLLLASSAIPWINDIVMWAVENIPIPYFQYMEYVVWGIIGGILGFIVDKW